MEHAILRAAVSFAAGLALTACAAPAAEELPTLLPQPRETVWKSGSYRLPERVRIGYDSPGLAATAGYLAEALAPYATATTAEGEGDITLSTDTASLAEEAYRLSVSRPGIRITAGSPRGAANGTPRCGNCSRPAQSGKRRFPVRRSPTNRPSAGAGRCST